MGGRDRSSTRIRPLAALIALAILMASGCGPGREGQGGGCFPATERAPLLNEEGNVSVATSYAYYEIHGDTASELRRQKDTLGPVDQFGHHWGANTDWRIRWSYPYRVTDLGCSAGPVSVSVAIVFTLPRWCFSAPPDSDLAAEWNRYFAAVSRHEQDHADLAVTTAAQIEMLGSRLPPYPSCGEYETAADSEGMALLDQLRSQEADYDLLTLHGALQGAVLP